MGAFRADVHGFVFVGEFGTAFWVFWQTAHELFSEEFNTDSREIFILTLLQSRKFNGAFGNWPENPAPRPTNLIPTL